MKRPLALLSALALLAALAWLGRSFLSSPAPARAAAPGAAPGAARGEPVRPAGELAAPERDRERPGADTPEVAARAQVALREEQLSGPRVQRTLRIVDGATGAPLAGARALWTPVEAEEKWLEHPAWDLERCDAWLAEHGREDHSAADGSLALALAPEGEAIVLVQAGAKAGRAHVAARGEDVIELKLVHDGALEVLVIDPTGAPLADIPVELVRLGQGWGRRDGMALRTSNAEGRVGYAHLGLAVSFEGQRWGVGTPRVLGGPAAVPLEITALPPGPVTLTVPATGSLVVEVRPGAWQEELPAGRVALLLDEGIEDERLSFWSRPDSVESDLVDGRGLFRHVALGRDLIVEASDRSGGRPTRLRTRGPTLPGQVLEVALTLGQDHPVLRLRVLDAAGTALAGHDLKWTAEGPGRQREIGSTTGDQGTLLLHLAAHQAAGQGRKLHLEVAAKGERPGGTAAITLPDLLPSGLSDLGEVRVTSGTPLVAGVVRSPSGAPVAGAEVQVEAISVWGEDQRYYEDLELGVETASDGTFVARGEDPGKPLRVSARHGARSSLPVECEVGASALVLDLLEVGTLAGRVLLDEGMDASRLDVTLRPAGPDGKHDWRHRESVDLEADGSFAFAGVRPGPYDLWLGSSSNRSNIPLLEGLDVPAGDACSDPRLAAIDMRGRLLCLRVELVPPRASERVMGTLSVRPVGGAAGGEDGEQSLFLQGPEVTFVVEARAVDLTVDVQGFRRVEFADVREDLRVELRRGLPVRLRIPDDVTLPVPPQYLKAYVAPGGGSSMAFGHFLDSVFDERREVSVFAPASGRLQVYWLFEERSENSLTTSSLNPEEPTFVEVLDVEGEQVFDVEPPREALESHIGDG